MVDPHKRRKQYHTWNYLDAQRKKLPKEREIYSWVPKGFAEEDILEGLPQHLDPAKARDVLFYIGGSIAWGNRESWFRRWRKYEPVFLSSIFLANILGEDYFQYLKFFLDKKILHRAGFIRGVQPFAYYYSKTFQDQEIISVQITHTRIVEGIIKREQESYQENEWLYKDYAETIYWYTTGKLQVNFRVAKDFLEKLNHRFGLRPMAAKEVMPDDRLMQFYNQRLRTMYNNGMMRLLQIKKGQYNIKVDGKGWRLYSTLTMLMSPLRNFITYDGEELCALDIRNSQPFHLCFAFNKRFWINQSTNCSLMSLRNAKEEEEEIGLYDYFLRNPELLQKAKAIVKKKSEETEKYIQLTEEGQLYDYLSDQYSNKYKRHASKDHSKQRFVIFLYHNLRAEQKRIQEREKNGKSEGSFYSDYRHFESEFPQVAEMMEILKHRNYTDIARILQRLEARMLLFYVVRAFSRRYPEVPIFTVHDSIITLTAFKDRAEEVVKEVYADMFELDITLKSEPLNLTNALETLDPYINKKAEDWGLDNENMDVEMLDKLITEFSNPFEFWFFLSQESLIKKIFRIIIGTIGKHKKFSRLLLDKLDHSIV